MSRRASLGFVELMVERRDVLRAALGALAAGIAPAIAAPQDPAPTPSRPCSGVLSRQRSGACPLARQEALRGAANDLREPFAALSYEQYVGIKMKPGAAVWAGENKGFSFEPLHRGPIFTTPVELFIVEGGVTKRIAYDQAQFDYGGLKVPEKLPDMGFSGFRVLRAQNGGPVAEVAMFQGASFYRACAAGQNLGTSARGLSIRTADPRGEEFPAFRIFWIEKPALGRQYPCHPRPARLAKRHRRLPLYLAPGGSHDRRYGTDAFSARGTRSYRHCRARRRFVIHPARPAPRRRHPTRGRGNERPPDADGQGRVALASLVQPQQTFSCRPLWTPTPRASAF